MKKMMLTLVTAAITMTLIAANSYRVTFFQTSVVNGVELKPGEYRLDVNDTKATIQLGKQKVEADVKVETMPEKFSQTSVRYTTVDGKYKVSEIRIGGTNTKLVLNN